MQMNALQLFDQLLTPCRVAVDATCGNGHDTLKLAALAERVYAFDIQKQAIDTARARTGSFSNVRFFQSSFADIAQLVPEPIDVLVFNLGYLPGGDKQITTQADVLGICLQECLPKITPGGRILIVSYPGHTSGAEEAMMLDKMLSSLDQTRFNSFCFEHLNGRNHPPKLYMIERSAR